MTRTIKYCLLPTLTATLLSPLSASALSQDIQSDPSPIDWHGAQWIGGDAGSLPFFSQYFPLFQLAFKLHISDDCKSAGIRYGANDLRLLDSRKNAYGVQNAPDSSYVEINFAPDSLRFFRKGFTISDSCRRPIRTFPIPDEIDFSKSHDIIIRSNTGITTVIIDGNTVASLNVSPTPGGGDYIAYPVVGDVGYSVNGGEATISDFEVQNFRSPHHALSKYDFGTVSGDTIVKLPETGMTTLRSKIYIPDKKIVSATLQATARGIYDAYINDTLVDQDAFLNPGASQYNRSHYFQTFEVAPLLHPGENTLGATLAEGWWSGAISFDTANWNWFGDRQSLLAVMSVNYVDGSSDTFITRPDSWEYTTDGPFRYGSLFQGEVFDASRPLFGNQGWKKALPVDLSETATDKPNGSWPLADDYSNFSLLHDNRAAVRRFDTIIAGDVRTTSPGQYVYDMGFNHAGVPSVTFHGLKKGQKVILRYAEVLYPDHEAYPGKAGIPMVENLRAAMAQDIYIASGADTETFSPRSTFHGYRYIEITGIDSPLPVADVKSNVLSSVENFTSSFECSDPMINRLVANIRNSTLSNIFSIPSDCPQRNERMGWSGDISVFVPALSYLTDARHFINRHTRALRDTREQDGAFAPIAPMGGGFGGPLWQSAGIILPWRMYLQYGDTACLKDNYEAMKEYVSMVADKYIDPDKGYFRGTESWVDLGDWLGPQCNQNEEPLLFDSYLIYELDIMQEVALVLGYKEDARRFAEQRAKRAKFVNASYVDPEKGTLVARGFGSQHVGWAGPEGGQPEGMEISAHSSYAVPLALNVFSDRNAGPLAERLHKLVNQPAKGDDGKQYPPHSLMTGFIGTPWILYALADNGYAADAYSILLGKTYPSWLYPVSLGATSVWERLNSMTEEDGFGRNNGMNSFNHYAFGCVYDWLIQRVAGINPDPSQPGFKHFTIAPVVDPEGRLSYAKASYQTRYGTIVSNWRIDAPSGKVIHDINIPDGTTATVILPDGTRTLPAGSHHFEVNRLK